MEIGHNNKILIMFILGLLCISCGEKNNYEKYIYCSLENAYKEKGKLSEFNFNLSTVFKTEWDTLFLFPSNLPSSYMQTILGIPYKEGYERLILKYNNQIVYSDSIDIKSHEWLFDTQFGRYPVAFYGAERDSNKSYSFFTTMHFLIKRDVIDNNPYYTLYPDSTEHSLSNVLFKPTP